MEAVIKAKAQSDSALSNAKYAAARSSSLLLAAIGLFLFISDAYLIVLSAVMIAAQLFDGIIGMKISAFKTIGPILTALGNAAMLALFLLK